MNRLIREVAPTYTQTEADIFNPSISPESLPYILSSVVSMDGKGEFPRPIRKYFIHTSEGSPQVYQGAYLYPYWGVSTMFAHVEVVFDEVPIPHESVLKWCALAMKAGPASSSARANQLVVVKDDRLHYLWRVLSLEAEAALPSDRSLDITNLHLWRWHPSSTPDLVGGKWVCGRVSLDVVHKAGSTDYVLTTSRGPRTIPWDDSSKFVPEDEPIHKLYMALLGENLL